MTIALTALGQRRQAFVYNSGTRPSLTDKGARSPYCLDNFARVDIIYSQSRRKGGSL